MPKTAAATTTPAPKHNVNPSLEGLLVPISELRTDPHNARRHDERDLAEVAGSYARHGQQKPIVALEDGTVIAGNGQFVAARDRLGWTHIAAVRFADREGARAYALADNRTAELSKWDDEVLAKQLRDLAEEGALDGSGFTLEEVMKLVGDAAEQVAASGAEEKGPPPANSFDAMGGKGGVPVGNTNHVRMVQLFLSDETHPAFMAAVNKLAVTYGVDNVTDVCIRAVHDAAEPRA